VELSTLQSYQVRTFFTKGHLKNQGKTADELVEMVEAWQKRKNDRVVETKAQLVRLVDAWKEEKIRIQSELSRKLESFLEDLDAVRSCKTRDRSLKRIFASIYTRQVI
jgi:hypothetical protein